MVNGTPMTQDSQPALSSFMSKESADRLALGLCEMHGAALKFGKILSIHDESLVPALWFEIPEVIEFSGGGVRDSGGGDEIVGMREDGTFENRKFERLTINASVTPKILVFSHLRPTISLPPPESRRLRRNLERLCRNPSRFLSVSPLLHSFLFVSPTLGSFLFRQPNFH
ncbi:hypothetical protein ISN44_As07g013340 [Arabidopsis suecica]|uniref:Uncharacterized protein n=1 Tax=Arabidopsis suecica TaxID=45249 RepID=A0A8T2BNP6_ARASU|nr:hypothetical protein ISN44_As07g013340 [Arabidopsis suecica]